MKKFFLVLSLISFLILLLISCDDTNIKEQKDDCISGVGVIETQILNLTEFSSIETNISGKLNIEYVDAPEYSITSYSNLIDSINFSVSDEILLIESEKCIDSNDNLIINLKIPILKNLIINGSSDVNFYGFSKIEKINIEINGSGTISNSENNEFIDTLVIEQNGSGNVNMNIFSEKIIINSAGSGNIDLDGVATNMIVDIAGSGTLKSFQLEVENCNINVVGSGDSQLFVTNTLDINIAGSGDVFYKGGASVTTNITGSGKATKTD